MRCVHVFLVLGSDQARCEYRMVGSLLIAIIAGLVLYLYIKRWTRKLRHIPAIPSYPIVGSIPFLKPDAMHLSIEEWTRKLGPLIVAAMPGGGDTVLVSSYEGIREVCSTFCHDYITEYKIQLQAHRTLRYAPCS